MNYDPDHHYRVAYGMMFIFLTPYFFYLSLSNFKSPIIVLFTLIVVGNEYSFSLPRKAMKIYEEIKFKSLIEKINSIIRISSFLFFSGSEIYFFDTNKYVLLFISLAIIMIWDIVSGNQSFIIGTNSIIIGKKLISHDSVSKISYAKKNLVIVANGKSYKIYNLLLGNQRYKLEKFKKVLEDKVIN
jgi:hypothetical protein